MKKIIFTLLYLSSFSVLAYDAFDEIRCNGQLVEAGSSLNKVLELCGEPLFSQEESNPWHTLNYVTYAAPSGGSAKYYLLFRDGVLVKSGMRAYNHDDNAWVNPDTFK